MENPKNSWLWRFSQAKARSKDPNWKHREYDACVHCGARAKKQVIESNIDELEIVVGQCKHLHDENDWSPYQNDKGEWVYPGHEEAEFTATLAFNIAVAFSMFAVRVRGFKLPIPKPPGVSETGTRRGWSQLPPAALRRNMMAPMAQRLGLLPPVVKPGPWFDEDRLHGQKRQYECT